MKNVTHDELASIIEAVTNHTGGTYGCLSAAERRPWDFPADEAFPIDDAKTARMLELACELERLAREFSVEVNEARRAADAARPPEPTWTVIYRLSNSIDGEEEYEGEPQPYRSMALDDVADAGSDIPLRLIGPDGTVELEGQALIDAGRAYMAQIRGVRG